MSTATDITGDTCDLLTIEAIDFTATKGCYRYGLMFDVHVDMDQIRPCGNPLVSLQQNKDGEGWVTLQSEQPRRFVGWENRAGGVTFQRGLGFAHFELDEGDSISLEYRVCFQNFLIDCTECVDCDNPDEEPEDLNTQPRITKALVNVVLLKYP